MITKLEGDIRREVEIDGVAHVVTISPRGFLLTLKGRRKGLEVAWKDLVSGDAALATALNASLTATVGAQRSASTVVTKLATAKRKAGAAGTRGTAAKPQKAD